MREAIDRILRDPSRDPRAAIGRSLLVDFRDVVQLRQHPRFFVRNFELENFAAFELALPNQVDEIFDSAAGECGNAISSEFRFIEHVDDSRISNSQIPQNLPSHLGLLLFWLARSQPGAVAQGKRQLRLAIREQPDSLPAREARRLLAGLEGVGTP